MLDFFWHRICSNSANSFEAAAKYPIFLVHTPRILTEEVAQCREVAFLGRLVDAVFALGGSSTSRSPQDDNEREPFQTLRPSDPGESTIWDPKYLRVSKSGQKCIQRTSENGDCRVKKRCEEDNFGLKGSKRCLFPANCEIQKTSRNISIHWPFTMVLPLFLIAIEKMICIRAGGKDRATRTRIPRSKISTCFCRSCVRLLQKHQMLPTQQRARLSVLQLLNT